MRAKERFVSYPVSSRRWDEIDGRAHPHARHRILAVKSKMILARDSRNAFTV